jgi:hypothetical protein
MEHYSQIEFSLGQSSVLASARRWLISLALRWSGSEGAIIAVASWWSEGDMLQCLAMRRRRTAGIRLELRN